MTCCKEHKNPPAKSEALASMQQVIETLLGPDGCPWDKAQTPVTLCDNLVEEVFELTHAIRQGDSDDICEELGDVLFLVLLISELGKRGGGTGLAEALERGASKMIRRHPHVFGEAEVNNRAELIRNWEEIKKQEKAEKNKTGGALAGVASDLPPLLRAYRVHSRAARAGFSWENVPDVEKQLACEWDEWRAAVEKGDKAEMEQEFGDVLFTLVELGRRHGIKANSALDSAVIKFVSRFNRMEELAEEKGLDFTKLGLDEMNALWAEVKDILNNTNNTK
jgi:MazG family protein